MAANEDTNPCEQYTHNQRRTREEARQSIRSPMGVIAERNGKDGGLSVAYFFTRSIQFVMRTTRDWSARSPELFTINRRPSPAESTAML